MAITPEHQAVRGRSKSIVRQRRLNVGPVRSPDITPDDRLQASLSDMSPFVTGIESAAR